LQKANLPNEPQDDKLSARAARFGLVSENSDESEKKKARAERFGIPTKEAKPNAEKGKKRKPNQLNAAPQQTPVDEEAVSFSPSLLSSLLHLDIHDPTLLLPLYSFINIPPPYS
jgi:hypothetical protein